MNRRDFLKAAAVAGLGLPFYGARAPFGHFADNALDGEDGVREPPARPDPDLQREAQRIMDDAVARGEENSLQFCAYRQGRLLVDAHAGWRDFDRRHPVDARTIFPVYSTSKGVPAAALTRLIDQGRLSAETRVADYWPEFAQNGKENTLVLHLLNHSSGLPQRFVEQSSYEKVADWPHMIRAIERCASDWPPGTKTRYQSLTYGWVTAELIQRVTGRTFRDYVAGELFGPAGITDFWFGTTPEAERNAAEIRRIPPVPPKDHWISVCDPLDELMRQPVIRHAMLPGFNGIATARALARFYDAILAGRFFSRSTLDEATELRRPESHPPRLSQFTVFGYGFVLSGPVDDVGRVFGHGGFGGSDAMADKRSGLSVGFTAGVLGDHPCRARLFDLVGLVQRRGWLP